MVFLVFSIRKVFFPLRDIINVFEVSFSGKLYTFALHKVKAGCSCVTKLTEAAELLYW